jgi:DNA mismatch repair protein MutS2
MLIHPESTFQKLGFTAIREAIMDLVRTGPGREETAALQPVSNPKIVAHELQLTGEMMELIANDSALPFEELRDIRPFLKQARAENSILEPEAVLHIRALAAAARNLKPYFSGRSDSYPALAELATGLIPLRQLEEEIARVLSDNGLVRDNASSELHGIRRELGRLRNSLRTTLANIIRKASKDKLLAETEPTIRNGRMVLPVKAEHKRKLSGFIHDESATGQTVYLEPVEVLQINNDIRQAEAAELREIERILRALTSVIRGHRDSLYHNSTIIGRIDAIRGRARFCNSLDAAIPEITDGKHIQFKKARNPILLMKTLKGSMAEAVVPLNLDLEAAEQALIITGPNAGGKSVAMKTAGLCQLMMQSGLAIPADEGTTLPVYDSIFVDLGDDQSVENDLSTFSSRLLWMRETLARQTKRALILVDEAGTGTDPEEGVALYQAFLEQVIDSGARVIVTTHHGQLKVFANDHPACVNGAMEFDQEQLSPTYRFTKGIPGSSFAFEIGGRMGVPKDVLARARKLVGSSRSRLEALIVELQKKTQEMEAAELESAKLNASLQREIHSYEEQNRVLKSQKDEYRKKALDEARDIVLGANRRIEELVELIRTENASKESIKTARTGVKKQTDEVGKAIAALKEKPVRTYSDPPVVGDTVRISDSNTTGELISRDGRRATVIVNGLTVHTEYAKLLKAEPPKKKKELRAGYQLLSSPDPLPASFPAVLDLRGKRGDEAVKELTWYLDEAIRRNLHQLEIIHGKGDGILKKLVHEHLATRREVKHHELAPWERGGPGCTLVEL